MSSGTLSADVSPRAASKPDCLSTSEPVHGEAWQPRLAKGMETLVDNVVSGIGGMPPYGLCMDCNAEQFRQLIRFMATPAETEEH